jgi:AcrR family transcriptional regulator
MAVRDDDLLTAATQVLLHHPTASLAEVAAQTGVSRTTLYSRFPTRQALLVGLAQAAMDLVEKAYVDARLDEGPSDGAPPDDTWVEAGLLRVVEQLVPLGERVEFLMRERSLDAEPELVARYAELDRPLVAFVTRAQETGALRRGLPAWWIVASLVGSVYAAWEAIADGALAPRDAPALVLGTVLDGVRER